MADLGLIKSMVADGWGREAAIEHVDAVTDAIKAHLLSGKGVRLDGIGDLRAPRKVSRVGFPPDSLREQRKIELRHGNVLEQGEIYADPRRAPRNRNHDIKTQGI